jgi:acetyl-CoA C-acetyltransferase
MAAQIVREVVRRAGVESGEVGQVVFGNVIHSEPQDMYLARVAAIKGGLAQTTSALTLNILCGSGLQAIVSAAQTILLGETDVAIGGGSESMSRGGFMVRNERWGQRMGDGVTSDMMVGALTDPFDTVHMGVTAEAVAAQFEITRDQQDAFAVESHRRATHATKEGYFKEQIMPVEITTRKGVVTFDTDEHIRGDATLEGMKKLKTVFEKDGTVTAGNASGINDAAAAIVMMERGAAEKSGRAPMARLVSYGHSGVDPKIMGIGPILAVRKALERAGLTVDEIDVIESNEAFAAQACAVSKELHFDPAKVNPNGGAIALGHPLGATGAILTVKAIYELHRTGGRYALITMCIGGGQGIAAVFERA